MAENTLTRLEDIISSKFSGKLFRGINFTDEPRFIQYTFSEPTLKDDESSGVGLSRDDAQARIKAMAEYLERKSLECPGLPLTKEAYKNLGTDAIDPARFCNFRDVDLGGKKEEYLSHLRTSLISWSPVSAVGENKTFLVPSQLVYVPFLSDEPMIRPQVSTGAAGHFSLDSARVNGLFEVIERDAFILKYLSKLGSPQVALDGDLIELQNYFKRYLLEVKIYDITSDLGIPTYLAVNIDQTGLGPAVSLGAKTGFNPREAIAGAMLESQQIRQWIRYSHLVDGQPELSDPSKVKTMKDRGYFWSRKSMIDELSFLDNGSQVHIRPREDFRSSLTETIRRLGDKGIEVYFADITHERLRGKGFHVTKAIAPDLHPLFLDEDYPLYDSKRLNDLLGGREVNKLPVPFL